MLEQKFGFITLFLMVFLIFSSSGVSAQNIGVVDLEKVFMDYKHTQESDEILRVEKEKKQKSLSDFEEKVKRLKDNYDAKRSSLSIPERDKEEEKLQKELDDLQRIYQKFTQELKEMNDRLIDQIRDEIQQGIEYIKGKEKIELVLQKDAVLSGGRDITDKVIEYLNTKYKTVKKP